MSFLGEINGFANSINPFKGPTDWLTNNTLAKLPVVGKPLGQLADWGDSHPAQVGAAIGAAFGGSALLAGGGAAGVGGAADVGTAGAGTDGLGGALTTSSGFGGVGTDGAVSSLDGASIDPALAGDDIDAGGGWSPASSGSGASGSNFNWQQMARMLLSHQQGSSQQGSGMGQAIQFNQGGQPQSSITPQQRMAQALLASGQGQSYNPQGQYSPTQGMSQMANAALAAYLMNMHPSS